MGFSLLDVAFYILWPVTGASKHHDDDSTVIHSAGALRGSGNYIVGSIVRWRWAHELQIKKSPSLEMAAAERISKPVSDLLSAYSCPSLIRPT